MKKNVITKSKRVNFRKLEQDMKEQRKIEENHLAQQPL